MITDYFSKSTPSIMSKDFFVTLLSNSSTDFYTNTLSSFTNNLKPPLVLHDVEKWKVGLTDIRHNYLFDYVNCTKDDEIIFTNGVKKKLEFIISIEKLPYYIAFYAKNPGIYNQRYFHDFLDLEKLDRFPDEPSLSEYETKDDIDNDDENIIKINLYFNEYINDIKERKINIKLNQKYTCKQIMFKVIKTCFEMLDEIETKKLELKFGRSHSIKIIIEHFIAEVRYFAKILQKYNNKNFIGSFMYIYTDIIAQRHVGDEYHRVLNVLPISEIEQEYTAIKNVQYYPVNKGEINSISILLTDEKTNLIPLEGGYSPTCVTLHFKKEL